MVSHAEKGIADTLAEEASETRAAHGGGLGDCSQLEFLPQVLVDVVLNPPQPLVAWKDRYRGPVRNEPGALSAKQ